MSRRPLLCSIPLPEKRERPGSVRKAGYSSAVTASESTLGLHGAGFVYVCVYVCVCVCVCVYVRAGGSVCFGRPSLLCNTGSQLTNGGVRALGASVMFYITKGVRELLLTVLKG